MKIVDSIESIDKILARLLPQVEKAEYTVEKVDTEPKDCEFSIEPKSIYVYSLRKGNDISVLVEKDWSLEEINKGPIPSEIIVTLSNGSKTVLNSENGWSSSIEGLPNYTGEEQSIEKLSTYLKKGLANTRENYYINYVLHEYSKEDILIQIIKYALIMSDNKEAIEIAPAFTVLKKSFISRMQNGEEDYENQSSTLSRKEIIDLLSNREENGKSTSLLKKAFLSRMQGTNENLEKALSSILARDNMIDLLVDGFFECNFERKLEYDPEHRTDNAQVNELIDFLKPTGKKNYESRFPGVKGFLLNRSRLSVISKKRKIVKQHIGKDMQGTIKADDCDNGILLLKHPDDKSFKLIAIAKSNNSINSECQAVLSHLKRWFQELHPKYKEDAKQLQQLLVNELDRIGILVKSSISGIINIAVAIEGQDFAITSSRSYGKNDCTIDVDNEHIMDVGAFSIMELSSKNVVTYLNSDTTLEDYSKIVLAGNVSPATMFALSPDKELKRFQDGKNPVAQLRKIY